jgi:epoxyqueuosine reductase
MIQRLRDIALSEGAALFGVAALQDIATSDFLLDPELLGSLPYAISIAVRVSPTVLDTIGDHPNQLYFHHYRQLNGLLDRTTLRLTAAIEAGGRRALAVAASQIVDWQNQRAHLSHKRIAVAAGLGWIGRNNLLVTPEFGSQVRLATILCGSLDIDSLDPLTPRPLEPSPCGSCHACVAVCPAKAIKETPAEFDHQACFAQLKEFQRQGHVGQYICGICVRACGQRGEN